MNIKITKAQLEQLGRTIPKPKHIACKPRGQVIQLVSDYSRTVKQNTLTALLKKED